MRRIHSTPPAPSEDSWSPGLRDSASKLHSGRLGVHTRIPVRRLPGRARGPPLKVQLDPRKMFQGGAGHARVHAPVLLPNSGPKCREAPGGQSNADLHPTRGDCTPLPLSCHLQVTIAWCSPPMTRRWLPQGQRRSEALMGTQARLRVAKGEDKSFSVCVCVIVLNASVCDSVNTSSMWPW